MAERAARIALRIDRLVVRTRGLPATRARELAPGLGESVLRRLTPLVEPARSPGAGEMTRIDAGTVRAAANAAPATVREQAASAVAKAVALRIASKGER